MSFNKTHSFVTDVKESERLQRMVEWVELTGV